MRLENRIVKITLSGMFLGLALILPFLTGQIPEIGSMLCPMHLPVLLCGYLCGGTWGMVIGLIAPLLRSMIFGMPPMFPTAFCMAFELATYGLIAGVLYQILPKKKSMLFVSLIAAMIIGRIVWGLMMFGCLGFDIEKFGFAAFVTGAITNALAGIVLQIVLIPVLMMIVQRKYFFNR